MMIIRSVEPKEFLIAVVAASFLPFKNSFHGLLAVCACRNTLTFGKLLG